MSKKHLPFLIITLATSIYSISNAQEIKSQTGIGYYNPQIGGDIGNVFYTDISIKLPSEFYLGLGFGLSDVFTEHDDSDLFEGFRSIRNHYHFRLLIDKRIHLDNQKRHFLNLGTGFTYIQLRYAEPFASLNPQTNGIIVGIDESDRKQDDAGFLLNGDYGFKTGKFIVGIRSELHFLLGIGLGGVIISPQITIDF